jgi:hypothetical protein
MPGPRTDRAGTVGEVHGYPDHPEETVLGDPRSRPHIGTWCVSQGRTGGTCPFINVRIPVDPEPVGRDSSGGKTMGISASILLVAIGAILRFAVTADVQGINLDTVGIILMIVGIVGGLLSLVFWSSWGGFRRDERI